MDQRLQDIIRNVEAEVKKAVEYVDKTVVPAARKETSTALKNAARELDRLAEKLRQETKP